MADMSGKGNVDSSSAIRGQREAAGFSREELAFKAGVSLRTIERIEAGEVEPRRATLSVIEGALATANSEISEAAA